MRLEHAVVARTDRAREAGTALNTDMPLLARLVAAREPTGPAAVKAGGARGPVRVAIQHRQRMCREMLAQLVRQRPGHRLVGTAATGDDLVAVCEWGAPDVVLLEFDVDDWDPCWLASVLSRRRPCTRFVGMGAEAAGRRALRARQAGLSTLVCHAEGAEPVVAAVMAASGRPAVRITLPPVVIPAGRLSTRELQVLNLVALGLTSQESSLRLHISAKTVENHKQRLFAKLGVQNQAHAVAVAIKAGLMPGSECAWRAAAAVGW